MCENWLCVVEDQSEREVPVAYFSAHADMMLLSLILVLVISAFANTFLRVGADPGSTVAGR